MQHTSMRQHDDRPDVLVPQYQTAALALCMTRKNPQVAAEASPESTSELTPTDEPTHTPEPPTATPEPQRVSAQVVEVVDGDTLKVNLDGQVHTVRLIGVDTPETVDPRKPVDGFGQEASAKAYELLDGQTVALEVDQSQGERDKYDRLLRYVWLPDPHGFDGNNDGVG
jgi:micrococcal nuclease